MSVCLCMETIHPLLTFQGFSNQIISILCCWNGEIIIIWCAFMNCLLLLVFCYLSYLNFPFCLLVQVVGFGEAEGDFSDDEDSSCDLNAHLIGERASTTSAYGEVSKLTFIPPSSLLPDSTMIDDIRKFTASLTLYPYHKILK